MIVNFRIFRHGKRWIAINGELTASGETLEKLNESVVKKLKMKLHSEKETVRVIMSLDNRTKPFWINYKQYCFDV
ncbi:MAG: DUF5395 family protein [Archaeoglobaceae archaeon]